MAVTDFALCTLADVNTYLNLATSNTNRNRYIEDRIEETSVEIESECSEEFVGRMRTEYLDGDGDSILRGFHAPLNAIPTLLDDTDRDWDSPAVDVVKKEDYMIYRREGWVQLYNNESYFAKGKQNVKIEYHSGFNLLTVSQNKNDWLAYNVGGSDVTVQIPRGEYDCYALASKIKYEMAQAAGSTYCDVSFNGKNNKFTINLSTSGFQTLNLKFATGANSVYSIATLLGWIKSDLTGATRYSPATTCVPHIPSDLKGVCVRITAQKLRNGPYGENREGIKQERIGDYAVTFEDIVSNDKGIKKVLTKYSRWGNRIG